VAELTDTLVECFAAVFPDVPRDRLSGAAVENTEEWDSIASVTLLAVLEEEFGVQIDDLDLPELTSFEKVHDYLAARVPS
jgi:acyl carrier protein